MPTRNVTVLDGNTNPAILLSEDKGLSGSVPIYTPHSYDEVLADMGNYGIAEVYLSGTISTSGNNTIVVAPGSGNYIRILNLELQNESAVETLTIVRSGTSTDRRRVLLSPKGTFGFRDRVEYHPHSPLDLATNTALVINLNGANTIGYNITYVTRTV